MNYRKKVTNLLIKRHTVFDALTGNKSIIKVTYSAPIDFVPENANISHM
mgnify:CR=1 FL=1